MNVLELTAKILKGPWRVWEGALWIMMDDVPKGPAHIADARELIAKENVGLGEPRGWGWLTGGGHGALALSQQDGFDIQRAIAYQMSAAPSLKTALENTLTHLTALRTMANITNPKINADLDKAYDLAIAALASSKAPPKPEKTKI